MAFNRKMTGVPTAFMPAEGFSGMDTSATTPCQREATARLGMTLQLEQEAFLSNNPTITTVLETYFSNMVQANRSRECIKDTATQIIELCDHIDNENPHHPQHALGKCRGAQKYLNMHPNALTIESCSDTCEHLVRSDISDGDCTNCDDVKTPTVYKPTFTYEDVDIDRDLKNIYNKHYPPPPWQVPSLILPTPNTLSSSFISIVTSETTLPTPEPIQTPEPTLSEVMMQVVSNTVDKAIFSLVNEAALRYDTAYVELTKAVENAMEIPVIEIRADIAELFFCAYKMFELNIIEKERIAAEIAWEKRMRKKLKRTLRRLHNFKGYETPPTPKSEVSSHESYKVPPHRPCKCHPQFHYNRYPKDRFGIYLPRQEEFCKESVTAPPAFVGDEEAEPEAASTSSA